jgi:transcriptional regulator with XRE-family HTH domain
MESFNMYTYNEPSYERVRRMRLLRLKYLNDYRCKDDEFSEAIGTDVRTLKRIESGREEIDFAKASKVLRVSIDYLMAGKIMAEDQFVEPVVHRSQIGSVMHSCRIERRAKNRKSFTLKAVAKALNDISSMELKRIEELGSSKYLRDAKFLKKVARLYELPVDYVESLARDSFLRGDDRIKNVTVNKGIVRLIEKDKIVEGIIIQKGDLSQADLESLKRRIEIEVGILRSKSNQK